MSICKLGKYKKYFVVNEKGIQAKPKYICYIWEKQTYYFGIKTLHFAWPGLGAQKVEKHRSNAYQNVTIKF